MNKTNGRFFYTNRLKKKASLKLLDDCLTTDELLAIVKLNKKQLINAISVSSTREQLHSIVYELGNDKISIEKIKKIVMEDNDKNSYYETDEPIKVQKINPEETEFSQKNILEETSLVKHEKLIIEPSKPKIEPEKSEIGSLGKIVKTEIEPMKSKIELQKPQNDKLKNFFVSPSKADLEKTGKTEKEILSIMKNNDKRTEMRLFIYTMCIENNMEIAEDFIEWNDTKLQEAYDTFSQLKNPKKIRIMDNNSYHSTSTDILDLK